MMRNALFLGFTGAVAALLLSMANHFTEPLIHESHEVRLQEALKVLAAGAEVGQREENPADGVYSRWPILPDSGWILELEGRGYGGKMTIISAYKADGEVIDAKLLQNSETVGFGKKAEEEGYMKIFAGKGAQRPLPLEKNQLGPDVDVVSGATVTFVAISKAIAGGSELVKDWNK